MITADGKQQTHEIVLVSSCLAGINCRYDGANCQDEEILKMWRRGQACPVCPERLGGMSTPRLASRIERGSGEDVLLGKSSVINIAGENVTRFFLFGAWQTLKIVRELNIKRALFKKHSPSCGLGKIYGKNRLVQGDGVCASLLLREGVSITCR